MIRTSKYNSHPGRIDPWCELYHRCRKGDRVVDQLERRGVGYYNRFRNQLRADIVVAQNGAKGLYSANPYVALKIHAVIGSNVKSNDHVTFENTRGKFSR